MLFSVCLVVVFAMWTAASLAGAGMRMTNSVYALCGAGIASIFAVLGAAVVESTSYRLPPTAAHCPPLTACTTGARRDGGVGLAQG